MIKNYIHKCSGTCSTQISLSVDTETNKISDIEIIRGCNGNLKGIRALLIGMNIDEAYQKLNGIKCNNKVTSCPDQIAQAILEYKNL